MKTLRSLLYAVAFCLALPACASVVTLGKSPERQVYAAGLDYNSALRIAVAYNDLPRCADDGPLVCSQQTVVDALRKGDNASVLTLDTAETIVRAPESGTDVKRAWALAALRAAEAYLIAAQKTGLQP